MKINYECVRDLLLTLEESLQLNETLNDPSITLESVCKISRMRSYSKADIAYSTVMMDEAGFIDVRIVRADTSIFDIIYFGLTFEGHQYLDGIKSNKIWSAIKGKANEQAVSLTFDLIKSAALALGAALIGHF